MNYINIVFNYIKELEYDHTHDIGHILRVTKTAELIAIKENADVEVVVISAFLHDIARPDELKGKIKDHALEGAVRAETYLKSINYSKYRDVSYCIKTHRFSNNIIPNTLEAKILQDADKLDALGYIGISRVFMHRNGDNIDERIKHFYAKILKLKDLMHTDTAKKLANEKAKIVENFVNGLEKELYYEVYHGKEK